MAVATATAIALGGLALSAAGTSGSFIQAGKQRRAAAKAREEASKAFQDARKRLDINYYKGLGIQKEPYELEREALLAAGAQAIEAGKEGEARGAAATAGRVQMAQQEGQAGVRTSMGQEMQVLDKLVATEEARLAGAQAELSLGEATGAQQAAAYSTSAANQAMAQGFEGLQSMGEQAQSFIPLYQKQAVERPDRSLPYDISASRLGAPTRTPFPTQIQAPVNPINFNPFAIARP